MTPIRINLLPHRQERRARAQKLLAVMAAMAAGLGIALIAIGQVSLGIAQDKQVERNNHIKAKAVELDKKIEEIKQIDQKMLSLDAKRVAVEKLLVSRGEAVRLFSTLAGQVPEGLYLKAFKQTGDEFTITGLAQSSARVSTFMRALADTDSFLEPRLVEVKAVQVNNLRINELTLKVNIERKEEADASIADAKKGQT